MLLYQKVNSSIPYNFDRRCYRDFSFLPHLHRDLELILVEEGDIHMTVEGEQYRLKAGDTALVLPDHIHSYQTEAQSRVTVIVFAEGYVPVFCGELGQKSSRSPVFDMTAEERRLVERMLGDEGSRVERSAALTLVGAAFLRSATLISRDNGGRARLLLHGMLQYVSEHYREDISLEGMAAALGYESHYLSRCFHAQLGKNFKQFVNEYRVHYAKQLILTAGRELTMIEIAFACGFRSVRNFNRAYRAIEGMEPRALLK